VIRFGAIDGPKPYEFIGFGAMDVTKPYEFMGFGAIDGPKPYEFIGFGAIAGPNRKSARRTQSNLSLYYSQLFLVAIMPRN
jgi:hypothetical protein